MTITRIDNEGSIGVATRFQGKLIGCKQACSYPAGSPERLKLLNRMEAELRSEVAVYEARYA